MAVVYESISSSAWDTQSSGDGDSLTIDKPTGLAVGDYLVAHFSLVRSTNTDPGGYTVPSGWTSLLYDGENGNINSYARMHVMYKVADASDVAASNFTFTKASGIGRVIGHLYRISGVSNISGQIASVYDDSTPTFSNSVTPSFADSLLLFLVTVADAATTAGGITDYAVATDNPTWTERVDSCEPDDVIGQGLSAGATTNRSAITATGNSTCTITGASQNSIGAMILLSPIVSVNTDATVLSVTSSIQDPTITGSATMTTTVADVTMTANTPTVTIPTPDFSNVSKSSSSWSNQAKS